MAEYTFDCSYCGTPTTQRRSPAHFRSKSPCCSGRCAARLARSRHIVRSLSARFEEKVDRRGPDECWPWTGAIATNGYGQIRIGRAVDLVHRVAYRLYIGPIPAGLHIDHVVSRGCTRRDCTNPAHLEAVTQAENNRRARCPR